jgi:hypothetical protein
MKEITVSVPSGPLGLNLDGAVPHCARVTGFIPLPGGSKGALEKHGGILHGSVLVKINGEDFSTKSLAEITTKLGALVNQQRSLTFRLPSNIAINFNPSHSMCKFNMDPRRKEEMKLIMKYDSSKLNRKECWFLVDMSWMEKWVKFIGHGGPIPGVISNQNLLEPEWADRLEQKAPGRPDTPKQGLEVSKDYRAVTPMVWSLFVAFHGAGKAPLLGR